MKLEEYKETYNEAPFELYEFGEAATSIEDCDELQGAACKYITSRGVFINLLEKYHIEVG